MPPILRRNLRDVIAVIVLLVAAALLGVLAGWPPAVVVLAAAIVTGGFGYVLWTVQSTALRTRLLVRRHGDLLLRQAEFSMEIRRLLEPDAPLPASRAWAACPDLLAAIVEIVQDLRPATVLECGAGISTITTALALRRFGPPGARMVTIEHDAAWAEETRRRLVRHGLDGLVTVHHAALVERTVGDERRQWYDVDGLDLPERVDLLVVDGPPRESAGLARYPAGPVLAPRLAPGAVVVLDDADRPEERTAVARWTRELGWTARERVLPTEKGIAVLDVPAEAGGRTSGSASAGEAPDRTPDPDATDRGDARAA